MNTKAEAYLRARENVLRSRVSEAVRSSNDRRCSPYTHREWLDIADFARQELRIVEDALAELESFRPGT